MNADLSMFQARPPSPPSPLAPDSPPPTPTTGAGVECSVTACLYNDGQGMCEANPPTIGEKAGVPTCLTFVPADDEEGAGGEEFAPPVEEPPLPSPPGGMSPRAMPPAVPPRVPPPPMRR